MTDTVRLRDHDGLRLAPWSNAGARIVAAAARRRIEELRAVLSEAESTGDPLHAAAAEGELKELLAETRRSLGLGGHARPSVTPYERSRINVTRTIKAALRRIARDHPSLAAHLRATVRTGTFCVYQPDPRVPVAWEG